MYDDVPLFLGLISDLFPGMECARITYPDFGEAVNEVMKANSYMPLENQVNNFVFNLIGVVHTCENVLCEILFHLR